MDKVSSIQQRWLSENRNQRSLWPLTIGAYAALLMHIAFFVIFFIYEVTPLFYFNFFSIILFAGLVYLLLRQQSTQFAMLTASTEVFIHQLLAIHYVGWEYGFQFYLLAIPVFLLLGEFQNRIIPIALSFVVIISIPLAYFYAMNHEALYSMLELKPYFALINLVSISLVVAFYIGIFAHITRTSEDALTQSQQDIAHLYEVATIDSLTQLINRMHASNLINLWHKHAHKEKKPFTLALLDIDNFKPINDKFGHDIGDEVLKHIAAILNEEVGEEGLVSRWGGEEFLIALPNYSDKQAIEVFESIRNAIVDNPFTSDDICVFLSATIGATTFFNHDINHDISSMLKAADIALYKGKTGRKNQVVFNQI